MDALRKNLTSEGNASSQASKTEKSKKPASGQREMLMPIVGKNEGKKVAAKEPKRPARQRKVVA